MNIKLPFAIQEESQGYQKLVSLAQINGLGKEMHVWHLCPDYLYIFLCCHWPQRLIEIYIPMYLLMLAVKKYFMKPLFRTGERLWNG